MSKSDKLKKLREKSIDFTEVELYLGVVKHYNGYNAKIHVPTKWVGKQVLLVVTK